MREGVFIEVMDVGDTEVEGGKEDDLGGLDASKEV